MVIVNISFIMPPQHSCTCLGHCSAKSPHVYIELASKEVNIGGKKDKTEQTCPHETNVGKMKS